MMKTLKSNLLILVLAILLMVGLAACDDNDVKNNEGTSANKEENRTEEAIDEKNSENGIEDLFNQVKNNSPTSERIQALEDIAMHYYWYGGDLKVAEEEIFKGITLHGDYDAVEEAFKLAIEIDPYDTDLKYSLASTQVLQKKLPEALQTYEEILNFDENHFDAQLMHAIYSKVDGSEDNFKSDFNKLEEINEQKAQEYQERIDLVEEVKDVNLETEV